MFKRKAPTHSLFLLYSLQVLRSILSLNVKGLYTLICKNFTVGKIWTHICGDEGK